MVEIKERLRLMQGVLPAEGIADLFKNEICSLQFRHICELISIACLAAQGDFKTQRAFREAYSVPEIFSALSRIFPAFFPQPSTVTVTNSENGGPSHHHIDFVTQKPEAFSEAEVVDVWNRSGNDLHRASVTKYLKTTFSNAPSLEPIMRNLRGLGQLLDSHVIPIGKPDSNLLLDVRMIGDDDDNVVAHFLTVDAETSTIAMESYRARVIGQ